MSKNNHDLCFACQGTGEVKVIKNIAQVGPYHLGKEIKEKCTFCKVENKIIHSPQNIERTLN